MSFKFAVSLLLYIDQFPDVFLQIRQNKIKKGKKKLVVVDKVFVTYKNDYVTFEVVSKKRTKSKKPKVKIMVDGKKWKKTSKIDKTLGDMWIKTINSKTIEVAVQKAGFTLSVKRGSIFFKATIKVENDQTPHVGLCKNVPKKTNGVPTSEYKMYSATQSLLGHAGTYVSFSFSARYRKKYQNHLIYLKFE